VDYAGLGGIQYIGTPKQPTLMIHNLINGEYIPIQYRNGDLMRSPTLPDLQLTLQQIIDMTIDG
jgi:Uma2 family endonuclease